jgi:hypothetical protein
MWNTVNLMWCAQGGHNLSYFREVVIRNDKLIIVKKNFSKSHAQFIKHMIILLKTLHEPTYLQ